MIATGLEEGVPGDWQGLHLRYAALSSRFARNSIAARSGGVGERILPHLTPKSRTLWKIT